MSDEGLGMGWDMGDGDRSMYLLYEEMKVWESGVRYFAATISQS